MTAQTAYILGAITFGLGCLYALYTGWRFNKMHKELERQLDITEKIKADLISHGLLK